MGCTRDFFLHKFMMKMLGVVRNDIFHIKDGKTSGGSKISDCQNCCSAMVTARKLPL